MEFVLKITVMIQSQILRIQQTKYENAFSSINLNEELDLVSPKFYLPDLKNENLLNDILSMKCNKGFKNFFNKYDKNLMNTLEKLDSARYVKFKHLLVNHLKQNNIYRKYKNVIVSNSSNNKAKCHLKSKNKKTKHNEYEEYTRLLRFDSDAIPEIIKKKRRNTRSVINKL